ncbi:MAG TPA: hypothetical protein VGH86_06880 [Phenylobacterium sp.]|jgi:hypothetical protein
MGVDRREALLAGLAAWGVGPVSAQAAADPLAGEALYADVKTYSDLGEHRTGTPGDTATTAWMLKSLRAAGYDAQPQAFDYPVFEVEATALKLGDELFDAFPYWTPKPTPPGGVSGQLSLTGGPGKIALVFLGPGAGGGLNQPPPAAISEAVAAGSAAVVVVTESPLGELSALNRTPKAAPWPVPVILVAGSNSQHLRIAVDGVDARVHLDGRTVPGKAENVIGRRPGRGKHLVISTPKSGWFHCAGERGSGVAIWLGLARWLAATSDWNLTVVATSGHEFDGYGGHIFTDTLAPKPAETRLWLHIGANVAAYDFLVRGEGRSIVRLAGPQPGRLLACSDALMPLAAKAFAGQPGYAEPVDIDRQKPPGELTHFQNLGYAPLIGVVSLHPLHHTRRDLPDVTGPAMLEPVARGLQAVLAKA